MGWWWVKRGWWWVVALMVAMLLAAHAGTEYKPPAIPRLTLDEAVVLAVRQNPEVLRSIEEIKRTRGLLVEVRARALPHVSVVGTYTQQDERLLEGGGAFSGQNIPGTPSAVTVAGTDGQSPKRLPKQEPITGGTTVVIVTGTFPRPSTKIQNKSWTVAVQATQVIYSGGQVNAAFKIARFTEDSSYYALRDVLDQVVATTRTQFYEVLRNRGMIRVQEESLRVLEAAAREQRLRLEAGTVARINVLRAQVEAANVRPELIAARNNYIVSQWRLAKTLGIARDPMNPGRIPFEVVGELGADSRAVPLGEAFDMARVRRAWLQVRRKNILIQKEQIRLELGGYKPTLEANVGYETRNSRLSEDLTDVVNGYFFGVTGNWDIFDGFATAGRVKQARAQLETARIDYEEAVLQVDLEVQETHARLQQAREVLATQFQNIQQAEETVRLANERLAAGAGTQLELLDARVALTRARVTELGARYELNAALAEFERVTGAGTLYLEKFQDPTVRRGIKQRFTPCPSRCDSQP